MIPPETTEAALDLIKAMESYNRKAFRQFEEDEQFYEGDFGRLVQLPEGFNLTVPVTMRAIVDEAVDNITPMDVQITYNPRRIGNKPEADADLVKQFLKSVVRYWRTMGDVDPIRDAAKNGFISGLMCGKCVPDWTLWPSLSEKQEMKLKGEGGTALKDTVKRIKDVRQQHFPLVFRSLGPRTIIADPSVGGRKLWQIERYQMSSTEVKALYSRYEQDFQSPRNIAKHRVHEVWTASWVDWNGEFKPGKHWIFVDERAVVHGEENKYNDLPYSTKFSGFGRQTYEGKPEHLAVGFFTPQVKSLGKAEARRFSQLEAIVAQLAFPIFILPHKVGDQEFDTSPGAVNFVPDEVYERSDRMFLKIPIPDQSIMTSLNAISQQIERGTTQAAIRGVAIPGTDSAAQYGMYSQQAKLRLTAVQMALEDMISWACQRVLYYIDQILEEDVSVPVADEDGVTSKKIGPKNIRGHYDVSVKFMPSEEQLKGQKLALANDAIVKGGMSPYDALTFAGFDNPTEMIARRMAYDVLNEPPVKRALGKAILEEWGLEADAMAMQEQMDQGVMQKMLSDFMNMLQAGTMRNAGSPEAPAAQLPPGQDPMAAIAQQGMGPMALNPGRPPTDPALQQPQQVTMG